MNKYSKKKNIWNTTYDLQTGPICVVLGAAVLSLPFGNVNRKERKKNYDI